VTEAKTKTKIKLQTKNIDTDSLVCALLCNAVYNLHDVGIVTVTMHLPQNIFYDSLLPLQTMTNKVTITRTYTHYYFLLLLFLTLLHCSCIDAQ